MITGDVIQKHSDGKANMLGICENVDISITVKIQNTDIIVENIDHRSLIRRQVCIYLFKHFHI